MTGEGKHWGPTDPGWVPDPRPVPDALTDTYTAPTFNGVDAGRDWVPLREKLEAANLAELLAIFGGSPVDPSL